MNEKRNESTRSTKTCHEIYDMVFVMPKTHTKPTERAAEASVLFNFLFLLSECVCVLALCLRVNKIYECECIQVLVSLCTTVWIPVFTRWIGNYIRKFIHIKTLKFKTLHVVMRRDRSVDGYYVKKNNKRTI